MSTRALIHLIDTSEGDMEHYVTLYQHSDGHPSYRGVKIAEFVMSGDMVDGYVGSDRREFNGFGCFVAQYIAEFKTGTGGLYVHPASTELDMDQAYEYMITYRGEDEPWRIEILDLSEEDVVFDETPEQLIEWVAKEDAA